MKQITLEQYDAFLLEMYGERCPAFESSCLACQVWDVRDELVKWIEEKGQ